MKKEGTMRTIRKETEPGSKGKSMDQFCGRLIIWDVGTPGDDIVILAADYCHAKPDLSAYDELKPCALPVPLPETAPVSSSSLKQAVERFDLKYGFYLKNFFKKPLLN